MATTTTNKKPIPRYIYQPTTTFGDDTDGIDINYQTGLTLKGDARRIVRKPFIMDAATVSIAYNDEHYPATFTDGSALSIYGYFATQFEGIDTTAPITIKCRGFTSVAPAGEVAAIILKKKIYDDTGAVGAADSYVAQFLTFSGISTTQTAEVTLASDSVASNWSINTGSLLYIRLGRDGTHASDTLNANLIIPKGGIWVEYYIQDIGEQVAGS